MGDDAVKALRTKMEALKEDPFNTKTLSNALYGLQRFTGTEEVLLDSFQQHQIGCFLNQFFSRLYISVQNCETVLSTPYFLH